MSAHLVITLATLLEYQAEQQLSELAQRFGDFAELRPAKLYERDAYALPVAVLSDPAFSAVWERLQVALIEELTPEDFEWWHQQEPTP